MLDSFTFEGEVGIETFTGPLTFPVAFTLILNPESDQEELPNAVRAISQFLLDANIDESNGRQIS